MQVHRILKAKQKDGAVYVLKKRPSKEGAWLLSHWQIGSIVVSDDDVANIAMHSERGIVRDLAKNGAACLNHKVESL